MSTNETLRPQCQAFLASMKALRQQPPRTFPPRKRHGPYNPPNYDEEPKTESDDEEENWAREQERGHSNFDGTATRDAEPDLCYAGDNDVEIDGEFYEETY